MCLRLWQAWRIVDFTRTCITTSFFKLQSNNQVHASGDGRVKEGLYLVVEACAMILPPIGFFSLPAYGPAAASGFDMT